MKVLSVRGASTTAAVNSNVPLSEILRWVDLSTPSTFQRFYYKPITASVLQGAFLPVYVHLGLHLVTAEIKINDLILLTFVLFI